MPPRKRIPFFAAEVEELLIRNDERELEDRFYREPRIRYRRSRGVIGRRIQPQ